MTAKAKTRMRFALALGLVSLACASCGKSPEQAGKSGAAGAPVAAVPEEESKAAQAALGSDAEVLLFGALGSAGTQQVVAINRLRRAAEAGDSGSPAAGGTVTGTDVTRVSILNKDAGAWSEVLRVDEYLKNASGFLRGAPAVPVAGWHLEIEQQTDKGRVLHFTPLAPPAAVKYGTVSVAWSAKAKRYQTIDRKNGQFLGEVSALELPKSRIR